MLFTPPWQRWLNLDPGNALTPKQALAAVQRLRMLLA
jgi:hypothetical protein